MMTASEATATVAWFHALAKKTTIDSHRNTTIQQLPPCPYHLLNCCEQMPIVGVHRANGLPVYLCTKLEGWLLLQPRNKAIAVMNEGVCKMSSVLILATPQRVYFYTVMFL